MRTKRPTKSESARMARIKQLRCVACWDTPFCCGVTEIHHLLSGGRRRGHAFSVPLGVWHHRGIPLPSYSLIEATAIFGPSLRLSSRAFHERYGTDDELLAKVNKLIMPALISRCGQEGVDLSDGGRVLL